MISPDSLSSRVGRRRGARAPRRRSGSRRCRTARRGSEESTRHAHLLDGLEDGLVGGDRRRCLRSGPTPPRTARRWRRRPRASATNRSVCRAPGGQPMQQSSTARSMPAGAAGVDQHVGRGTRGLPGPCARLRPRRGSAPGRPYRATSRPRRPWWPGCARRRARRHSRPAVSAASIIGMIGVMPMPPAMKRYLRESSEREVVARPAETAQRDTDGELLWTAGEPPRDRHAEHTDAQAVQVVRGGAQRVLADQAFAEVNVDVRARLPRGEFPAVDPAQHQGGNTVGNVLHGVHGGVDDRGGNHWGSGCHA